jgi:hypothetical protein
MLGVGFELTTLLFERAKIVHVLNRAIAVIDTIIGATKNFVAKMEITAVRDPPH